MITEDIHLVEVVFDLAALVATIATGLAIFTRNVVHGLVNVILSLLAVAIMIFLLGAPFAAALEVIVYAGAIMVLFVFAIMMLGFASKPHKQKRSWSKTLIWLPPVMLSLLLVVDVALTLPSLPLTSDAGVSPKQVGLALFGPYLLATLFAAFLLLTGLIGAYHLGRRPKPSTLTRRTS